MSLVQSEMVSIRPFEGNKRVDSKRVVQGFNLELHADIPSENIRGGSDWFEGTKHVLSIEQAEILYEQLGKSLGFVKNLEADGKIIISRKANRGKQR